ncbi:MAG: nucleotide sugar dehydrogenase [Candidatus Taylorbacteria bacterium]
MNASNTVSVIGLGKLGLPTAVFFASYGKDVICYDVSKKLVSDLNASIVESTESGLIGAFTRHRKRLSFTDSIAHAISHSNITFVIVPTPSLDSGEFSTEYVKDAANSIGVALKAKTEWHLVVLVSTVLPGETRAKLLDVIEQRSGKICGKDFGVCYNPEFIALGSVLHNLANPDFELIGESDARSGDTLDKFYHDIFSTHVQRCHMGLENAELVKVAINTFVTTKISYANMLAEICENVAGLDVVVVTEAIGLDNRIGRKYLGGGLGYGGPCFPRDNVALSAFARRISANAPIADATDVINRTQVHRLIGRMIDTCGTAIAHAKIAVLGLSYKQDTSVIEKSQAMEIVEHLLKLSLQHITVFDREKTLESAKRKLGSQVRYETSLDAAVKGAKIIVIAVNDSHFVPPLTSLKDGGNSVIMVDPWRLISPDHIECFASYCTVGKL